MSTQTGEDGRLYELTENIGEVLNKIIDKRKGWTHCGRVYVSLHREKCDWALEPHPDRPEILGWTKQQLREAVDKVLSSRAVVADGIVFDVSPADTPVERFRITLSWKRIEYDPAIVVSVQ